MSFNTKIQWTDRTWPVTTGCDDASPGCLNCYSKQASYRMGLNPNPKISGAYGGTVEKRAGVLRWTGLLRTLPDRLDWPMKWRKPARIFVGNMSDLFHLEVPETFIHAVFGVMRIAHWHTFQVLTKRADRMADVVGRMTIADMMNGVCNWFPRSLEAGCGGDVVATNVWLGVSVEDQKRADERIPHLLRTPAAVRFLSVEPMLAPIDLSRWMHPFEVSRDEDGNDLGSASGGSDIDWVIVGGESGHNARSFDIRWARDIRDQCAAASVACFIKQLGSKPRKYAEIAGAYAHVLLKDSHGGDWSEWSEDLRVREFPKGSEATVD